MKVAVVAEFYPRAHDPVLGVWAHRQALAARDAGAEVRVLVLHRPVPPRAALDAGPRATVRAAGELLRQPRHVQLDGLDIRYVPFVAPPRPSTYGSWGAWAGPPLAVALRALRRHFRFDLIHAHNAVPAADAVRRSGLHVPMVTSVHGGDVFHTAVRSPEGERAVRAAFAASRLVLANSRGIAEQCVALGATGTRIVHLGTDTPAEPAPREQGTTLSTLGHLVARKRHGDVLRALWILRDRWPELRYLIVGDGPERAALTALAQELGLAERVTFAGQLPHEDALRRVWGTTLMVMPSVDEAFGVAYIEAMAGGVPAVGAVGEPGPQEIASEGSGIVLVPPGDVERLAGSLDEVLSDPRMLRDLRRRARETASTSFSWAQCGAATVAAYREALG